MPPPDFEITLDLSSRCVKCGADRDPEGTRVLQSDRDSGSTYIVRAETACECGEDRVRIAFDLGDGPEGSEGG